MISNITSKSFTSILKSSVQHRLSSVTASASVLNNGQSLSYSTCTNKGVNQHLTSSSSWMKSLKSTNNGINGSNHSSKVLLHLNHCNQQYIGQRTFVGSDPYSKYKTDIKDLDTIDLNENQLIFQHDKESYFQRVKNVLKFQIYGSVLVPITTLFQGLDLKWNIFGTVLVLWSGTFYFMGKRLLSNLATRIYYNRSDRSILLVHYYPDQQVLKIPLEDIKPSLLNPDTLFLLLQDNTMFILQNQAKMDEEALMYVLSGHEYELMHRANDEAEYKAMVSQSQKDLLELDSQSKQLDKELEQLEKELKKQEKENTNVKSN